MTSSRAVSMSKDGDLVAGSEKASRDLETVDAGHHDAEDHEVGQVLTGLPMCAT